jgi:hypothetical protein
VAEVRDGEDLLARLSDAHNAGVIDLDHPLVAQTPNGSYTFAVERLEQQGDAGRSSDRAAAARGRAGR